MKLNIFMIPRESSHRLKTKLESAGMTVVHQESYGTWSSEFYFSVNPDPVPIPWAGDLEAELAEVVPTPLNNSHYGVYYWESDEHSFAISFGKAFLYIRECCDREFGLNMARRIGKKDDVRQKSARRYAGKKKREIRSYQRNTSLDLESGESVDLIQSATTDPKKWGKVAKFGASMLLSVPIKVDGIPDLLSSICTELDNEPLFGLPIIEVVKNEDLVERYDEMLVSAIIGEDVGFEANAHELIGVDFIFPGHEKYIIRCFSERSDDLDNLTIDDLRDFIQVKQIPRRSVPSIKFKVIRDEGRGYTKTLKEALDFSIEEEKVFLQDGLWVHFNEEYIEWLNRAVNGIPVDAIPPGDLPNIHSSVTEPPFNQYLADHRGYEHADTNFNLLKLKGYTIEACDLIKGSTVYAVKFGPTKKLSYVCDQASNVVDLVANEPAMRAALNFNTYCIWIGLERVHEISAISDLGSIILKQRLDDWARKCKSANIAPLLRIAYKNDQGLTLPEPDGT